MVPCRTLRRLSPAELASLNEVEADKRASITTSIREVLGDSVKIPKEVPLDNNDTEAFDALWDLDLEPYEDDYESNPFPTNLPHHFPVGITQKLMYLLSWEKLRHRISTP